MYEAGRGLAARSIDADGGVLGPEQATADHAQSPALAYRPGFGAALHDVLLAPVRRFAV